MGRPVSHDGGQSGAEGQAQALRHVRVAVDRSAWLLSMLRKELAEEPGARGLRRLELHCVLADLARRQAGLSTAYDNMVATPPLRQTRALRDFVHAYDEFVSAVGAARMESRNEGVLCPPGKQSTDTAWPWSKSPGADGN